LNTGPKTIFFPYNATAKPANTVDQIIERLKGQKFQTIIKIDVEKEENIIISAIRDSALKNRVHLSIK